ncbi:WD40 repeat-like protein [Clavulina sp. PMI_390]|nr:WD40 repeat-like protein [Clavulina sp. PMI_390]
MTTNGHSPGLSQPPRGRTVALPLQRAITIARVSPPGTMMYEDSGVSREEYVRLVLQSLRDIGYTQTATVLEAESGYAFESDLIASFRESILEGRWDAVESVLRDVGVKNDDEMRVCQFLIRQQKYLECLESRRSDAALQILRNDLAPISFDSDRLHLLSSLMMCTSIEDLMRRAQWSGAHGGSRLDLLGELQRVIPATLMLPPRRLERLLTQAQSAQRATCLYHNSHAPFSLYVDHSCSRVVFPGVTTNVLAEHDDEVWNIEWSPDGRWLASGGLDRQVMIWHVGPAAGSVGRTCHVERVLRDHESEIAALAWSNDSANILTCSEKTVRLWNVKTGVCSKEIQDNSQLVTSVRWTHDGSGFYTGSADTNIFFYDTNGTRDEHRSLPRIGLRVMDFALTPDGRYLIAVGQPAEVTPSASRQSTTSIPLQTDPEEGFELPVGLHSSHGDLRAKRTQMIVFDLAEGTRKHSQIRIGDMTSIKISLDSRIALISCSPNLVFTWDIEQFQLVRRYMGHQHEAQVLRSCFGGADGGWIISGDEDHMIHVWHRDTGESLEILDGHKTGTVNAVAWNPRDDTVFASASDDATIRIWESPTWEMDASELTPISLKPIFSSTNGATAGSEH